MGLRINSNESALFIQRQTQQTSNALLRGFERLASGQRINRAADDAAGLAIVERFRAELNQLNQEVSNLQSGVNVVQTADGALGTQQDAVQRVRELALQASNGTLTDDQRAALNQEAQQLLEQIDETAANTEFNGRNLLDGSAANVDLGVEGGIQVNIEESTATSLGINGVDLSTQGGAQGAIEDLDSALNAIQRNRASIGAQENRFTRAIEVRQTESANAAEAESRIPGSRHRPANHRANPKLDSPTREYRGAGSIERARPKRRAPAWRLARISRLPGTWRLRYGVNQVRSSTARERVAPDLHARLPALRFELANASVSPNGYHPGRLVTRRSCDRFAEIAIPYENLGRIDVHVICECESGLEPIVEIEVFGTITLTFDHAYRRAQIRPQRPRPLENSHGIPNNEQGQHRPSNRPIRQAVDAASRENEKCKAAVPHVPFNVARPNRQREDYKHQNGNNAP